MKKGDYCALIGKWEQALEDKKSLMIYGDGSKRRDFTHVNDIVDALVKIYEKQTWGHVFELGRGENYSVKEIANMFEPEKILYEPDKPGEALSTCCDTSLAKTILNWEPREDVNDYIEKFKKTLK